MFKLTITAKLDDVGEGGPYASSKRTIVSAEQEIEFPLPGGKAPLHDLLAALIDNLIEVGHAAHEAEQAAEEKSSLDDENPGFRRARALVTSASEDPMP